MQSDVFGLVVPFVLFNEDAEALEEREGGCKSGSGLVVIGYHEGEMCLQDQEPFPHHPENKGLRQIIESPEDCGDNVRVPIELDIRVFSASFLCFEEG